MLKFKRIYIDADRPFDDIKNDLTDAGSHEGVVLIGDYLVYREDCMKVVETVKSAGYKRIRIQSTGHKLQEAGFVQELIDAGVFQYEIELSEFHTDVAQVFNNIRMFEGYGQPDFSPYLAARISITKNNFTRIGDVVRMVLQCRTDRITLFFDDYDVKMSDVTPYLSLAIETGLLTQVWIQTENIPLCLMDGYEHHVSEIYMEDEWERKHVAACGKCVYKTSCEGIEVEYTKMHGDGEFKAVLKSGYAKEMVGLRR
jgi:hypothetical protein